MAPPPAASCEQVILRLSFDRGTLLIDSASNASNATSSACPKGLPGFLWDPRVGQYRAPAWRYAQVRKALRERSILHQDEALGPPGGEQTADWGKVKLRPYQQAALLAWQGADHRGVLVLPTGSGKTRVACAAMAATGAAALCLVPTRALLQQWHAELGRHYSGTVGRLGDGEHQIERITVSTYESALRHMWRLGGHFELLVVDEAHHFGTGLRDEALEMSAAPLRLGLTATPAQGEAATRIGQLVGPTVFELSIGDLTGRWLADFDLVVLRLRLSEQERTRYDRELATFRQVHSRFRKLIPNGSWQQFRDLASQSAQGRRALAAWRQSRDMLAFTQAKRETLRQLLERHRDNKVLVFTWDNETAYRIGREHLVMPITCDISRTEREQMLSWFRSGKIRALVSARVLNEGVDVPDAEVAIILGGACGEREHVQRVGRLLRPRDGKRAMVYELVSIATAETRQSAQRRRRLAAVASTGV